MPSRTSIRRNRNGSYTVTFNNTYAVRTVVASSVADVERWFFNLPEINRGTVVGFGVKSRLPLPPNGRVIALLLLCVGRRCLIYQIFHAHSIPCTLRNFLWSSRCRFVGMGAIGVANQLWDEYDLRIRNLMDLGEIAAEQMGRANLRRAPLRVLALEVLGLRLSVRRVISAWDENPLSRPRIARACADVFMASKIGGWLLR